MRIQNILKFDFIDAPNSKVLIQAFEELFHLRAIDHEGKLTDYGE